MGQLSFSRISKLRIGAGQTSSAFGVFCRFIPNHLSLESLETLEDDASGLTLMCQRCINLETLPQVSNDDGRLFWASSASLASRSFALAQARPAQPLAFFADSFQIICHLRHLSSFRIQKSKTFHAVTAFQGALQQRKFSEGRTTVTVTDLTCTASVCFFFSSCLMLVFVVLCFSPVY